MTRTKVGNREHVHLFMDEAVINGIKTVAQLKNTTASELIRIACREYLIREAAKASSDNKTIQEITP